MGTGWRMLWQPVSLRVESAFPLDESVRRLASATERRVEFVRQTQRAVGVVTARQVSLQRAAPFVLGGFAALYEGGFEETDGSTHLQGAFVMSAGDRAVCMALLGCVLFAPGQLLWGVLFAGEQLSIGWLLSVALIVVALGSLTQLILRKIQGDVSWLTQALRQALSESEHA